MSGAAVKTDNSTTVTARKDGKKDPLPLYSFHVEINGIIEASFTACSSISVQRNVTELREGGVNDGVRWLHDGLSFGKVTLTSGIAHSEALWNWFKEGDVDAKVRYRQVAILQMVPYTQLIARRYDLKNCMPTVWTGPNLNTGSSEVAVETLELAFQSFALTKGT
jgi:phage tail-like protein